MLYFFKSKSDKSNNINKDYVKTEIFPREVGRKIGEAEEIRHASDYDDFWFIIKGVVTIRSMIFAQNKNI